ncbi:hypothetical protein EJ04DRAFT_552182 [Polyplosphaeria fusca]|uniref:Uncharacterized protein n=1 Tax=Polyplosphaeria fusca TaxID=682080 RepID=A0A9P4V3G1_9PLEO|nr:hypothetical protein EJ04DRAFT_552182 [Polyplosphaeria fusca]
MPTHLQSRALRLLKQTCCMQPSTIRQFSSTALRQKNSRTVDPTQARLAATQGGKAPGSVQQEAMESSDALPDDVGILTGTFVRLPIQRLWTAPTAWPRYEWKWLKTRFLERIQHIAFWWRFRKQKASTSTKGLARIAEQHHYDMFKAYARNDKKKLAELCLSGLRDSFTKRLSQIEPGTQLEWERKGPQGSLLRRSRVVSNRSAVMTLREDEEAAFRQVVVRIKSMQRLRIKRRNVNTAQPEIYLQQQKSPSRAKYNERAGRGLLWTPVGGQPSRPDAQEQEAAESQTPWRDVEEYLVLQKRIVRGVEDKDWKIWGFVSPTPAATKKAQRRRGSQPRKDEAISPA